MSAVVAALIPVFLLIAAGVLARRFLVTEEDHWVGIERLVYFLLFPALLIDTLALADLSKVPVATVGGALLTARSLGLAMPVMETLYSLAVAAERTQGSHA